MTNNCEIHTNGIAAKRQPKITIVTPFLNDDPTVWIDALKSDKFANDAEIIIVDDGTNNSGLTAKIISSINSWPAPATLLSFKKNQGRSSARNHSIERASGEYILFIDADMIPARDDFLKNYIEIIDNKAAAIVFGGFNTHQTETTHDTELHHNLSQLGDCRPLCQRKQLGAYAIATNNLLVRRTLMQDCRFDDSFKGWGWEDTEWGLRAVAMGFGLIHIDNPAIHLGLDNSATMLKKYREAAGNLAKMLAKHPIIERFPSLRAARVIAKMPFHQVFRPIAQSIVLDNLQIFPIDLRRLAIKYWRASWAADAIKQSMC